VGERFQVRNKVKEEERDKKNVPSGAVLSLFQIGGSKSRKPNKVLID
jgi:hypothetical protein